MKLILFIVFLSKTVRESFAGEKQEYVVLCFIMFYVSGISVVCLLFSLDPFFVSSKHIALM